MPTAGEDYDIVIDDGADSPSTTQGLMVVRDQNGQLDLIEDILPPIQSPVPRDTISYAQVPPDQEIVWSQRSWHNGMGAEYFSSDDPFRYLEARGVDARFANRLTLAPLYERGGPIFADLSLEAWTSTTLLRSWTETVGSGGSITRETGAANVHEGAASAKMIRSGADVSIHQQQEGANQLAGEAVVFGAWVKQSAINAVRIVVSDAAGSALSSTNGGTSTETDEWINITASHTLHASTTKVTFKVEVIADATVYVDQLYLTVGTETGEDQRTALANLNGTAYFNLGPYVFRQSENISASALTKKAGADVTDLAVYGSNIYAALGDGTAYIYSADPTATSPTFTSSNLGSPDERADRFGVAENANGDLALWKALDTQSLNASISPTNSNGIYSVAYSVGDSDGAFSRIYNFAGALVIAKTNGLWMYRRTMDNVSLDRFVNIIQADVSPRGTSVANSVAYSAGMVFGDSLFVGKPNYGMYRIFYVQQGIAVWEPFGWLIGGEGNIDTSNYVMAFATDGDWLYILMKDSDLDAGGDAHVLALRQQSDGRGGVRWVAHQILEIPNLQSPSSSDAPNADMLVYGRRLLIVGSAADTNDDGDTAKYQSVGQVDLPEDHESPSLASSPALLHKGTFVTSYFDGSFPDISKQFLKITMESESLSSANTVTVEYQVDNQTSWSSVGTFNTSPSQTVAFPTQTTGKRLRLRLTLETTTLASKPATTPVVNALITHATWSPPRLRRWRFSAYAEDALPLRNGSTANELGATISSNLNTMRDQAANVKIYTDVDTSGVTARIVDKVERYVSVDVEGSDETRVRRIIDLTLHEVKTS
jgi:hypothetical protein